jgi:TolB protein
MRGKPVFLLLLLLAVRPSVTVAQLRATIFGPGSKAFPIAVVPLQPLGQGDAAAAHQFAGIVSRDLTLSGLVRVIPEDRFIEPEGAGVTEETIHFDNWSVIGALALVKGTLQREGNNLTVEARFFDVSERRQLAGRRYRGGPDDLRRMAHKFADEIMEQLTQERGPFDSQIAFLSTRGGRFKDLYVMSLDGGDVRRVTNNNTINLAPSWAPGNRGVLLTSYQRGNPDLFSVDVHTRQWTRLSNTRGINIGRMSPDGTRLAVAVERDGNTDIVILGTDGSLQRRLTDHWAIDVSPAWSPDGSRIAFCSSRGGAPQIYIIGADGSGLRRVTYEGSYNTSPAWSPKGDRIAYTSRVDGRFQVYTVKVDGTGVRQVTNSRGDNEDPSWAPDGRYLVFSSTRSGRAQLYVSDLTGSSQVELTAGNGGDTSPTWSRWLD